MDNSKDVRPRATAARIFAATVLAALAAGTAAHADVTVYASGLNNPRGLKFGPDGNLYIAEGGTGGTTLPPADPDCVVIPPVGPYLGSATGSRISMIDGSGNRTTVVDNLPSSQTSPALGNLVSGVADVAFVGNTMYAVLAGAGCSHGVPSIPNGVIRVNPNGSWTMIADLSAYQRAHPVQHPEEDDFEPDGTWYGMIAVRGDLYAVEPNHGEIVKVTTGGNISRVIDVSASQGHVCPRRSTTDLSTQPGDPSPDAVLQRLKVTPSGQMLTRPFNMVWPGVRTRIATCWRPAWFGADAGTAGAGQQRRQDSTVIADGLFFPTMTMVRRKPLRLERRSARRR
jgi:hypothetical protein